MIVDLLESTLEALIGLFINKEKIAEISVSLPIDGPKVVPEEVLQKAPQLDKESDFILTHTRFCPDGIFGELKSTDGQFTAYTLEHSYDNKPKLAVGTYTCVRGPHRLHGMTQDFITFEIKGVPDFEGKSVTGVLFHWGNYDKDSEGCVLLGSSETPTMIGNSRKTWADFMDHLSGKDSFTLTVVSS